MLAASIASELIANSKLLGTREVDTWRKSSKAPELLPVITAFHMFAAVVKDAQ